jgi:HSP20 family molecular chaperone IbpA
MKNCPRCGKKVNEDYDFCPYCGGHCDDNNNWGMLGKNDAPMQDPFTNMGIPGGFFNKMLGNAMRMIEKEMQKEMQNPERSMPKTKVQLYINGKKIPVGDGNIKIVKKQNPKKPLKKAKAPVVKNFSKEKQEKFATLLKENPETHVRRFSDRVIYEIKMPGVKSIEDISIRNLENSIEIKAIGKGKAYYKIISVGLPIIDFHLDKDTLILELEAKH